MVDANNTRATSNKIKDSANSKNKNDDISIANSLVPTSNATATDTAPPATTTAQAHSGNILNITKAHSGSLAAHIGSFPAHGGSPSNDSQAHEGSALMMSSGDATTNNAHTQGTAVNNTTYSLIIDTSKSRRDRAPAAFLHQLPKAKAREVEATADEEEVEEDNSPG
ncbi:hypothetical protein PGT21_022211 [Puccinia graminis f. sp. tritici]|uniref:Uncharacterized protein n=1 Tax=Puccinia graminis f. sp. tritici TaxID=56615 RepID=A0A5B0LU70_PUCGR|nr:hypothetical protein PGT21_022211 [Puccinia graminis f. sp. tritici]